MNELAKFDEVRAAIVQYKAENASLVFDYEDPQGNKDARSHIYKLRQAKTKIADIHKVAKAEALGVCRMLDGEKKKLTTEVNEMIDVHYKPIKEIEDREVKAAAEKANAERIEAIRVEAERAAETERRENELAEREAAAQTKEDELVRKAEKLEAAKQAEIDKQAALIEAAGRANRVAREAAAKVEQDKKDAVEQAERDKQAAIEAEKERQRKEDEAAQAEKNRLAKIEAARIDNESHRMKIEEEIRDVVEEIIRVAAESGTGGSEEIMSALILNEIPHVTINY